MSTNSLFFSIVAINFQYFNTINNKIKDNHKDYQKMLILVIKFQDFKGGFDNE
jgi:hypothetical protein